MKKELEINAEKYMRGILRVKEIVKEYDEKNSKIQAIEFRVKSEKSITEKLKKKGYAGTFENAEHYLNDLAGVRVICFRKKDVYELRDYLLERKDIAIVREKDYIKKPKKSGYRSLHLIAELVGVRVEIQLRTTEMHCWAEADHKLCYKIR